MGRNDPCLAPDDPRNLWLIFNKIEQTGRKGGDLNAGAVATRTGTSRRPKILGHFGFQSKRKEGGTSTRETAAKFKACKGIDKDDHTDVKASAAHPCRGVRVNSEVCGGV